jgi:hypothetical protein
VDNGEHVCGKRWRRDAIVRQCCGDTEGGQIGWWTMANAPWAIWEIRDVVWTPQVRPSLCVGGVRADLLRLPLAASFLIISDAVGIALTVPNALNTLDASGSSS